MRAFTQTYAAFHTICSFNILNTKEISYSVSLSTKTTTTLVMGWTVGSATTIYELTTNYIATDIYGLSVTTQAYCTSELM